MEKCLGDKVFYSLARSNYSYYMYTIKNTQNKCTNT